MDKCEYWIKQAASKMWELKNKTPTDEEIEKCFKNCVAKTKLIKYGKLYRKEIMELSI
jgi:hypothetical protein